MLNKLFCELLSYLLGMTLLTDSLLRLAPDFTIPEVPSWKN